MKLDAKETLLIKAEEVGGIDKMDPPAVKKVNSEFKGILLDMEKTGVISNQKRLELEEKLTDYGSAYLDAGMSLGFDAGKATIIELLKDQIR